MTNQPISAKLAEYKNIRSDLRESSVEILDRSAKWFIELKGDRAAGHYGFGDIDDYKRWLLNGRSPGTANTYLAMLKSFFSWLAKRRYIKFSPFDGVTLYKTAEKKFEIYSLDEVGRMLTISNELWKLIISLGLCGMRESEILNLCVCDIDFENSRLKITAKKDTESTWRWDIKDYHEAYIGFDDSIGRLLIERIEQLDDMPYVCIKKVYWDRNLELKRRHLLRQRLRNNPWGNFNRDFRALQRRALINPPKRFHDLRGTFTTERYRAGYDLKELQYLLRHSSISTTIRYIKNIDEQKLVAKSGEYFAKHYATYNVS